MKRFSKFLSGLLTAVMLVPTVSGGLQVLADSTGVPIDAEHFPDPNFRAIVASATYDTNRDGRISPSEGNVHNMHCENSNIYSIQGIEYFPGIRGLWCLNNNLTEMNLSNNTNITGIWCSKNDFTSLDFTGLPNLEWVYCFECDLRYLNISNNPRMGYLECNSNPNLGTLDVSHNQLMENIFCMDCGLTELDVSGCPILCELDAQKNHLTSIDLSNNPELRRLDIWDNEDLHNNFDVSGCPKLQMLNIGNINCSELDVTHNPELQLLIANYNEDMRTLDLSGNPKLADLRIECDWRLTSLDLSHNPKLYYALVFGLRSVPSIDISNNPHLLDAYNNGFYTHESHLGDVHSYTVEYGGSNEYFCDVTHCLCIDDDQTIITGNSMPDVVFDSYVNLNDAYSGSEQFVTRGQAIQALYESVGSPAVQGSSRFSDVSGSPYEAAIIWGETYNVCYGCPILSSDTFCPDELICREDFALMAHRTALYIGAGTALDYGRTDWYRDSMDIDYYGWGAFTWAMQFHVLEPTDSNFCYPHGRMTTADLTHGVNTIYNLDEAASYSNRVGANGQGIGAIGAVVPYADKYTVSGERSPIATTGVSMEPYYTNVPVSDSEAVPSGSSSGSSSSGAPSAPTQPTPTPAIPTRSPSAPEVTSEQGVAGFVERLYTVALERSSDPNGKQDWIDAITMRGETGADAARGFLYSPEFLGRQSSNEEFVAVLYRTFFNREPDQAGFNAWVGVLRNGTSKEEVIEGFINSTEWANLCLRYGIRSGGTGTPNIEIEPNQQTIDFATRLYTTCLGRNADPNGLMAWARQLANQRDSGTGAARGFFFSEEFGRQNVGNEEYVRRLYRTFMGREPDEAGFNAWVAQLNGGVSREEVFNGFALSPEFTRICASYGIIR
ncbi:MAG: DUF4214 domain-containing protein [Clostridiales bacterium]|nr:DUF4214 domain-containing protein [Clostridiales bacterium]